MKFDIVMSDLVSFQIFSDSLEKEDWILIFALMCISKEAPIPNSNNAVGFICRKKENWIFVFNNSFKGTDLVQDICDLHFYFNFLIRINEDSLFLLRPEVSTAFQTESGTPYLYVRIGDTAAIPWSSLRASLLSIYNSVGSL